MKAYYNEWDKRTAAWLRELIREGLIADGVVDERSICDVQPSDLDGFTQCHFFAGIGGWSYALRLAGWPDDRPVWTASLPCQPFSAAGEGRGASDDRHLWPYFYRIVRECRPDTIFGEQVARAVGFNWLDGVCSDLEAQAFAVGACVLGAHSVGAPHKRQRLFWVANSRHMQGRNRAIPTDAQLPTLARHAVDFRVEHAASQRPQGCSASHDFNPHDDSQRWAILGSETGGLEHANGCGWTQAHREKPSGESCKTNPWECSSTIICGDGKARRIEPSITPMAHGIPARMVRLRGYGNAIVPQVAAEFIQAFCHALSTTPTHAV